MVRYVPQGMALQSLRLMTLFVGWHVALSFIPSSLFATGYVQGQRPLCFHFCMLPGGNMIKRFTDTVLPRTLPLSSEPLFVPKETKALFQVLNESEQVVASDVQSSEAGATSPSELTASQLIATSHQSVLSEISGWSAFRLSVVMNKTNEPVPTSSDALLAYRNRHHLLRNTLTLLSQHATTFPSKPWQKSLYFDGVQCALDEWMLWHRNYQIISEQERLLTG